MTEKKLNIMAGVLFVAGTLIGGLILASGILANMPGANMLMAIAMLLLVFATIALIGFWVAAGKSTG